MTPAEAAVLLAAISANDNREVSEAAARAWSAALPDVELEDALEALPTYYRDATRDTKNWIYPGDVLELVRELYKRRAIEAGDKAKAEYLAAHPDANGEDLEVLRARYNAREEYKRLHPGPGLTRKEREAAAAEARERNQNEWMRPKPWNPDGPAAIGGGS